MPEIVIRTDRLTRRFGNTVAVVDVSLQVYRGEVFGLLGPNGGGKTTTVRLLCSLLTPTFGTAEVLGQPVRPDATSEAIRQRIGLLPEATGLYERLSAYRNLDFHAQLYGLSLDERRQRIEHLLRLLNIWDQRDEPVATFSRGMRQKIAVARAVVHSPDIVFLDEPTASLDPEAARTVREFIRDLRNRGHTVFLNTHNLDEAARVCDRVGILKQRLLAVGAPKDLSARRFGTWTHVELARPSDHVVEVLRSSAEAREVRAEGRALEIRVRDPVQENPVLTRQIVAAGGEIVAMHEEERGLEELYLSLVGESA